MRYCKQKKTNKSFKISIARFAILAICFVIVFGFAMTSGLTGFDTLSGNGSLNSNIAKADDEAVPGGMPTSGNSGVLNQTHFGYPGSRGGSEWKFTDSFSEVMFAGLASNVSAYKTGTSAVMRINGADVTNIDNISSTKGSFKIGLDSYATLETGMYALINYDNGKFLDNLITNNSNVTVKAEVKATISVNTMGGTNYADLRAFARPKPITAIDIGSLSNFSKRIDGAKTVELTSEVVLTKENPKLSFAVCKGLKSNGVTSKPESTISNMSIKFTITMNSGIDGANTVVNDDSAPIQVAYDNSNKIVASPYRPNSDASYNWPVTNASVNGALGKSVDYISEDRIDKLWSFANKPLGTVDSGKNYFKTLTTKFVDTYMETVKDGNPVWNAETGKSEQPYKLETRIGDSVDSRYTSGIKRIQIGDNSRTIDGNDNTGAVFEVYRISDRASQSKNIYIDGRAVGYATVTKDNRARVTVQVYFYTNAYVTLDMFDFGEAKVTKTFDVKGIDTINPNAPEFDTTETHISAVNDFSKISWYNKSLFNIDVNDMSDEEDDKSYSPYAWYYSVAFSKNGSFTGAVASKPYAELIGMTPFSVSGMNSFSYDFKTGRVPNHAQVNDGAKGAGYYRFTIYTMDLAGNVGSPTTYYAKADYEAPTHTISMNYEGGHKTIINTANGAWATTDLTVSLTFSSGASISGNMLFFEDIDGNEHWISIKDGKIVGVDGGSFEGRNEYEINKTISVWYSDNVFTITYSPTILGDGLFEDATKFTTFKMYVGNDMDADTLVEYINTDWVSKNGKEKGVWINIDKNKPNDVEIEEEDGYLATGSMAVNNFPIANRNWFTKGWSISPTLSFSDTLVGDFGKNIKVYIGLLVNSKADSFENNIGMINPTEYASYFRDGTLASYNAEDFDRAGGQLSTGIGLMQNKGIGLRNIYIWAVDQAGNISKLNTLHILVDPTIYRATTTVENYESVFGQVRTSISMTNSDNTAVTIFRRGETINLSFGIANGFVPYTLTRFDGGSSVGAIMLTNETVNKAFAYQDEFINASNLDASILFDSQSILGMIQGDESNFRLHLKIRKVVKYNITNTSVPYNGAPTVVPMVFEDRNDEKSREFFSLQYKDKSINNINTTAPTFPGNFLLNVTLDHEYYVAEEKLGIDYSIHNANATVRAIATHGTYGEAPSLEFTFDGLAQSDLDKFNNGSLVFNGSLKLNVVGDLLKLNVGRYIIVENDKFALAYYDLTFSGDMHTVDPRVIIIVVSNGQKKDFGDADPNFAFSVLNNQFVNGDTAKTVFLNSRFDSMSGDNNITYMLSNNNNIIRAQGENVGSYLYLQNTQGFDLNQNYSVKIEENENGFQINQKTLKIDVLPGQNIFVDNESDVVDGDGNVTIDFLNSLNIKYKYSVAPNAFTGGYISQQQAGGLSGFNDKFAITNKTVTSDDNFIYWTFNIDTSSFVGDGNIKIETTSNVTFVVKISKEDGTVVVISKNADVFFTMDYLDSFFASSISFDKSKFTVKGLEDVESWNISWSMKHGYNGEGFMPIGSYSLTPYEITITGADGNKINRVVEVQSFTIEVLPLQVLVSPKFESNSKIYGDLDSIYNFGFDFVVKNSKGEIVGSDKINAAARDSIYNSIIGRFIRAKYSAEGALVAIGSQFDTATNAGGILLDGSNNFYGMTVGNAFSISLQNYSVAVDNDKLKSTRLVIEPKTINIDSRNFKGKNKNYDGTTDINYLQNEAINIASLLARVTDKVFVVFEAMYGGINPGAQTIKFSKIALFGDQSFNYILTTAGVPIEESNTFEITYIDSSLPEGERVLIIISSEGILSLKKTEITLQKQYDGTTSISIANVTFAESNKEFSGFKDRKLSGTYSFSSPEIGSGSIAQLFIYFQMDDAENNWTIMQHENETDVKIDFYSGIGGGGIRVAVQNMPSTIIQRVISPESLSSISAINRRYDATNKINVGYAFKQEAIATRDSASTIGLELTALAADKNAGLVGKDGKIATTKVTFDTATVTNSNYTVDVEAFKTFFAGDKQLTVAIDKAMIMPNVQFVAKGYDGKSALVNGVDVKMVGGNQFTSIGATPELLAELANLKFNFDRVSFVYSAGKNDTGEVVADANVAYIIDDKGNVVILKHNVSISGMTVSVDNGTLSFLKNFTLYGGENSEIIVQLETDESSLDIDAYEFKAIAELNPKVLDIIDNNVKIENKVYDKNKNANVTVKDVGFILADEAKVTLTFVATFYSENIGTWDITVSNVKIVDTVIDTSFRFNYKMKSDNYIRKFDKAASITPAPVTVEIRSFDSKQYDGNAETDVDKIKYTLTHRGTDKMDSILQAELTRYYGVTFGSAYYSDKNANAAKDGYAFGLALKNTYTKNLINFAIAFESAIEIDGITPLEVVVIDGVSTYYYPLQTAKHFVTHDIYNKALDKAIFGENIYNYIAEIGGVKTNVYLLDDEYSGAQGVAQLAASVNFVEGKGKITKKNIQIDLSMAGDGIAYKKPFDGSNKFFGIADTDYVLNTNGIMGLLEGDIVVFNSSLKNLGRFAQTYVGKTFVEFVLDSNCFDEDMSIDLQNYNIGSATVRLSAEITALDINSTLNDVSIPYGTDGHVYNDITYKVTVNGEEIIVERAKYLSNDKFIDALFMNYDEYKKAFPNAVVSARYNIVDGNATVNASGGHVKLSGTFTLPVGRAAGVNSRSDAGIYEKALALLGGTATNYKFIIAEEKATITVTQVEIFVYANGTYSKTYGNANPTITLGYVNANGEFGFKNGQNASVFAKLPTAVFMLHNGNEWTNTNVGRNAILHSQLEIASFYGVMIDITDITSTNYIVKLRYSESEIDNLKKSALKIELPQVSGVSIADKTLDYTGDALANQLIKGAKSTDTITYYLYIDGQWVANETDDLPTNAGVYNIRVEFIRAIEGDENGYNYATFTKEAILTITSAKIGMSANQKTYMFNFEAHNFDIGNIEYTVSKGLDKSLIEIKYEMLVLNANREGIWKSVDKMLNAGAYRVYMIYDQNKDGAGGNFKDETAYVAYTVSPLEIKVVVDQASKKQLFVSGTDMNIKFSISTPNVGAEFVGRLPAVEARLYGAIVNGVQTFIEVTKPNTYNFVVLPIASTEHPDNFKLVGDTTGMLEIGNTTVSVAEAALDNHFASLTVTEGGIIVAEKLVYKEVFAENASSLDDVYWRTVAKHMSSLIKGSTPANLASIVKIGIFNGSTAVQVSSTVNMKVALPSALKDLKGIKIYAVNRSGGLSKLDYTYANGEIMYSTDFVDALVFVKTGSALPIWAIVVIFIGVILAVIAIALGLGYGIKNKKKKDALALETANANASNNSTNTGTNNGTNNAIDGNNSAEHDNLQ